MPWYTLYAPITGYCTSNIATGTYCPGVGGGSHPITGGSGFGRQLDLVTSTPGLQQIDFNGSSNIGSIRVTNRSNMCLDSKVMSPWKNAVDLEMFTGPNASGGWIGTVRYGHITSWVPDTVYNTINGRITYIGRIAEAPCSCSPSPCDGGGCGCYPARHLHMESKPNYTGVTGYNTGLSNCSAYPWAYYDSTWVYEYYLP